MNQVICWCLYTYSVWQNRNIKTDQFGFGFRYKKYVTCAWGIGQMSISKKNQFYLLSFVKKSCRYCVNNSLVGLYFYT